MSVDGAIADLAGRQHGRVARRQLVALGMSGSAIDRRIRSPVTCAASWCGYSGGMRLFGRRRKADRGLPAYSNEAVIQRIQQDAGVDRDTARLWFNEMLVFLDLVADSRDFLSPPEPVDVAWHAFILHTRDYEAYCRDRFGRVIHHEPTGTPHPASYRRAYDRRARLGPVDGAVWAVPAWAADPGAGAAKPAGGDVGGGFGGGDWGGGGSSCGGGSGGGGGGCGGGGG